MKTIIGRLQPMPTKVVLADKNHPMQRWSFDAGNAPIVGAPYSAIGTTESAMTYLDGNRVVQGRTTRRFFRDSQGRSRTESTFISARHPDHESPLDITINDPVAGKQYLLQTEKKTFTIVPWKGATAIRPPVEAPLPSTAMSVHVGYFHGVPAAECKTDALGERIFAGVKAVGTRVECTVPSGFCGNQKPITVSVEQWFSPELGVILQTIHGSSIGAESICKIEQIVRAEPDASLFGVPTDYQDIVALAKARSAAMQPTRVAEQVPMDPSRLPQTGGSPVLRTDFADQAAWEAIRNEIQQPTPEGFNKAGVDFIDDRAYEGMSKEQLLAAVPQEYSHSFIIVVDAFAVTTQDHPVLVINLWKRSGAELRAVASEVYLIENNLSLGNLSFEDFVGVAEKTGGVYRGS
jgi:hypothetical protein